MACTGGLATALRRAVAATMAAVALAGWTDTAHAWTADGAIITGVACVTYSSSSGYGYMAQPYCMQTMVLCSSPCAQVLKSAPRSRRWAER